MIRNVLSENLILPASDLLNGQCVSKYLRFLLKSQYWTRKEIDEFQNARLRELIEYAFANVPFYRDVMIERGLHPSDIRTKDDLVKLPVINKDIIRREGMERFVSAAMSRKKMLVRSSSGSTGQPFVYCSTPLSYSVNLAANLRGWYNFGWRLGDRYVKISQNPRNSRIKRLQDFISGDLYLATEDLSDANLHRMMQRIESFRPKVIRSYPDPLFVMAQYRLSHRNEFTYCPQVITTTGNVLHDNVRRIIEEAFGCKVFDAYASEGNSNVFECVTHLGYHSSEEYGITEVLDENGNPISGGTGHLVTTDLWNYAHPFIRYDVQDLVEVDPIPCPCGREHLRIKKILGRDNEILVAPSGRRFIVEHFVVYFEHSVTPELKDSIDQFQFIQHTDGSTTVKLVVNERYSAEVEEIVERHWSAEFGAPVKVEVVDRIPIMNNNKRRFIIVERQ